MRKSVDTMQLIKDGLTNEEIYGYCHDRGFAVDMNKLKELITELKEKLKKRRKG